MPFAQRENIHAFCEAAKSLGVKDINNFTADDLFEVFVGYSMLARPELQRFDGLLVLRRQKT